MTPQDIDLVRAVAEYTRRRNAEDGMKHVTTQAEADRRANIRILAAKCGEVLARTLYGIDINRHTS